MKSYGHLAPVGVSKIRISACPESAPYQHEGKTVRTIAYAGCLYNNPTIIDNFRIARDEDGNHHLVPPNNELRNGSRIDNIKMLNDPMKKDLERDFIEYYEAYISAGVPKTEPVAPKKSFRQSRKRPNVNLELSEERFKQLEEEMQAKGIPVHRKSFAKYILETHVGDRKKKS